APYSYSDAWSSELQELILEKISWIPMRIIDQLFSPVISVAAIVCVIGIVLFVISLMVRGRTQKRTVTTFQAPPPAQEPKVEAPKAEAAEQAESVEPETKEPEPVEKEAPMPEPPETEPEEIATEESKPDSTEPEEPKEK
ncbi:MAG: hypothetical protein OEY18_18790, partial [Candidatus Aminicenantes bacterium]|nr:hypothetical protein [Candidatus Aminicenantes bacterium]